MTLTLTKPEITVKPGGRLHENLDTPQLVELALRRGERRMSELGALVVETGTHTGRSAQDKFIVRDVDTKDAVWWGPSNKPLTGRALENTSEDRSEERGGGKWCDRPSDPRWSPSSY